MPGKRQSESLNLFLLPLMRKKNNWNEDESLLVEDTHGESEGKSEDGIGEILQQILQAEMAESGTSENKLN